jgi:hypothetical protein
LTSNRSFFICRYVIQVFFIVCILHESQPWRKGTLTNCWLCLLIGEAPREGKNTRKEDYGTEGNEASMKSGKTIGLVEVD